MSERLNSLQRAAYENATPALIGATVAVLYAMPSRRLSTGNALGAITNGLFTLRTRHKTLNRKSI
jgi:hypothetical protein